MRILMMMICALICSLNAHGGDKIGNGGGLWVCSSLEQKVLKAELVDLFEARIEHNLALVQLPLNLPFAELTQNVLQRFIQEYPSYSANWKKYYETVLKSLNFVSAELEKVDDVKNHLKPRPDTCPGKWDYVQFANFTNEGVLLVQKEFWESSQISDLDRVALLWHETVYLWLRDLYGDVSSRRARRIVGVLFAELDTESKHQRIKDILSSKNPTTPVKPVHHFCMIENPTADKVYGSFQSNKSICISEVHQQCMNGHHQFECIVDKIICEDVLSMEESKTCRLTNQISNKIHIGVGRNQLEALFHAKKECYDQKMFTWGCHDQEHNNQENPIIICNE